MIKTTGTLLALVSLLAACGTKGSGQEGRVERSVEAFTAIEVGNALDVKVEVGPETSVVVVGDDNLLELVATEVDDDELQIKTTGSVRPSVGLAVLITMPKLDRVDCGGAADVDVVGVAGERLEVDVEGSGDVVLAGTIDTLELEVAGAGDVDAIALDATHVDIDLRGAGDAKVSASESLRAEVKGAGDVAYRGNPKLDTDVSGAGEVKPL